MTRISASALICQLSLLSTVSFCVFADDSKKHKEEIQNLAIEIRQISQNLNANRALLRTEKDKLSDVEQEIINLDKKLANTADKIEQQKQRSVVLNAQVFELKKSQAQDQKALSDLIRYRYMQGEPNYLKMILNQENPYAVGRLANYLDYFTKALNYRFDKLREKAKQKHALQEQQKENVVLLEDHYRKQKKQQRTLDQAKKTRLNSVSTLKSKVSKTSEKLARLEENRTRLNSLLMQIAKQAEKMRKLEQQRIDNETKAAAKSQTPTQKPVRKLVKGGFLKQKGRLQYPVTGKTTYSFGKRIAESGMQAQGTFIATSGAQNVKTIFRGRVLFADYLKGYGLLLIIDHGDDHISLYGHNEVLYKAVGDQVKTNELVAKTGVSGGLKSHGLYFEIRNTATPVDPATWCR